MNRRLRGGGVSGRPAEQAPTPRSQVMADVQTAHELASLLRQLRRREARRRGDAELTYRELAAKTGWSLGVIGEYLAGKILPPTDRFDVLVRLLGATPAEQGALATARDRVEENRRTGTLPSAGGQPRTAGGPGGTARAADRVVPRQLPPAVRHFAGRVAELDALSALVDDAVQGGGAVVISAIAGTAGIGKTALAVHWAHQVADRFPDGQLYVNLRGFDPAAAPMTSAEAIRGFLDSLGVAPDRIPVSLTAQVGLYRSLLADKHMLVLLDNARDAHQVRPLLPGAPGCVAAVTSRNRLTSLIAAEGAYPVTLDLLSVADARDLLARRLGPARVSAEPQAADEIIATCARLPLALSVAAARAATSPGFPLAVLAEQLRDTRGGLDTLDGGDPDTDVRAVFSWSYRALRPATARLFRLLGLHPGPDIALAAAASLSGLPVDRLRTLLDDLARAHLVAEHAPGRFTFHDLLRAYAGELAHTADTEEERRAALRRMLDHYLHTAHTAALLFSPHRDPILREAPTAGVTPEALAHLDDALTWFTAEHSVLLGVIDLAAGAAFHRHAYDLAWTCWDFFDRRGHWRDWAVTQQSALVAAQRLSDRPAQAHAYRGLAYAYARLGRFDEAHRQVRHAFRLYEELGDHTGQARTHHNVAWFFECEDRHREALDHALQALELYRAVGHRTGQARALNAVGWHHAKLGDYQHALSYCRQALVLQREIGDRRGAANTWDSLGYAHHQLGEYRQAARCYQHALDLVRDLGDRYGEAEALAHLGDTHEAADEPRPAQNAWQEALRILEQLGHTNAEDVRRRLHEINGR